MDTTIQPTAGFDTMADDLASAIYAFRRQPVDGAFEAVEYVALVTRDHLERQVMIVSADLALRHHVLPRMWSIRAAMVVDPQTPVHTTSARHKREAARCKRA
jgi:hypothetical protein